MRGQGRAGLIMTEQRDPYLLTVGLVCLDIISTTKSYPEEDTDQRVLDQTWNRGGNASNTSTVLALLGAKVECIATLAKSHELNFILESFKKYGIDTSHCQLKEGTACPTSVCIINKENGSRTVLHHNRNLPELSHEEFKKLDLKKYSWIHFEDRPSVDQILLMCGHINQHNAKVQNKADKITISVELEKKRIELAQLMCMADYVFISKDHSQFRGFKCKEDAVQNLYKELKPGASLICPWGETGTMASTSDGTTYHTPIFSPPGGVTDTLGAGDTFIAGTVYSLSTGKHLQEAIRFGSEVAGFKCGITGFDGLKQFNSLRS